MQLKSNILSAAFVFAILAGGVVAYSAPAHADMTFNAGAKATYEANVNGSPTQASRLSDSHLALNASAVYYTPLDALKTSYFIGQFGASSSTYNRYNSLDNSAVIASAGLYKQFNSNWSGQVTGRGFNRETKQDERDSNGAGATFEVKNQLSKTVWVKAIADYDKSKANLNSFSYSGSTYGVNLGYLPLQNTFINLGFSHTRRDFKTTTPFRTNSQTLFAEVTQRIAKNWYVNGGYAFQDNKSNIPGTAYENHIVSLGLNYSY